MQDRKLHGFPLRGVALDDSTHGNVHNANAQVHLWELSPNIRLQPPDRATASEANTQQQTVMRSSMLKLTVKQVFN